MQKCAVCKVDNAKKWYMGPICDKCYRKEWYELNKSAKTQLTRKKKYYENNKEKIKKRSKLYAKNNPEYTAQIKQKWYEKNKFNMKDRSEYLKAWRKEKSQNDPNFKIKNNLRSRLSNALRRHTKNGSAIKDLGCSIEQFKEYLESKFQPGMTWDNYGKWHIDHIVPLSSFNLSDRKQFLKACHYTNLQPLWAIDNIKKSNNIIR